MIVKILKQLNRVDERYESPKMLRWKNSKTQHDDLEFHPRILIRQRARQRNSRRLFFKRILKSYFLLALDLKILLAVSCGENRCQWHTNVCMCMKCEHVCAWSVNMYVHEVWTFMHMKFRAFICKKCEHVYARSVKMYVPTNLSEKFS
jgi:hypothetical protein